MDKVLSFVTRASLAGIVIAAIGSKCLYNVDGGEAAVIWDMSRGVNTDKHVGEGTHFIIPWYQRAYVYEIRTQPRAINTSTGTKDLQTVKITLRVLYKPNQEQLPQIHKELGTDYDERVLPSIGNEVMKAVVAQYNAEELITRREAVSQEIAKRLREEGLRYRIDFVDISIVDLAFSKEFTNAVERKQVAQQDAERQKFVVMKADQERLANITRAEGEAEAAKLISDALAKSGAGLIELRKIEAARDIAEKLSNSRNVTYLPSSGVNYLIAPGAGGAATSGKAQ